MKTQTSTADKKTFLTPQMRLRGTLTAMTLGASAETTTTAAAPILPGGPVR